ncbi:pyrroline-5-carboxylate reductase 3 isoform X3 [Pezoporus wallicus]|uniref:pyrroline-5-carboxylate reductase 3 isoform X3 n=1 Tax=Pezoporus wallicus TaxID=35540 RepID=UPI00254B977F|nr:pyrroline-5-carboxylate reductase 3 isoform X3 [Pezoporus wallicus]
MGSPQPFPWQGLALAPFAPCPEGAGVGEEAEISPHLLTHPCPCGSQGKVPASSILASAPSDKNLDAWRAVTPLPVHGQESGCRTTHCNLEVLQESTLVILATKPHVLPGVLQEIRPAVGPHHIVVSLVAGVTLQTLQRAGAMVFARGSGAGDEEASLLKNLLSSCGLCEEVPESYINIHTGLSGSGVAYVYLFAEALAEGAVKMGMPGGLASRIAAQTLLGAAKMMLETGEHPAKLRGDVCTPGGTTIHALHQLEKGALRATVMNAVEAATNRARSMAED